MTTTTTTARDYFPALDPRQPGESAASYGHRALLFACATGWPELLSDDQLEAADHVYPLAVANPDLLAPTRDQLTKLRHRMIKTLANRRAEQAAPAAPAAAADVPPAGVDSPRMGPGAPLAPSPVRPTPPALGQRVAGPTPIPAAFTVRQPVARQQPAPVADWGF